jgi:SEC-C motif
VVKFSQEGIVGEQTEIVSFGEALAQHLGNILRDANELKNPPFYLTLIDDSDNSKWQMRTDNGAPPLALLNAPSRRPLDYPVNIFVSRRLYPTELTTGDVVVYAVLSKEPMPGGIFALHTEVYPFTIPADPALKTDILANGTVRGWTGDEQRTEVIDTATDKRAAQREQLRALIPQINKQVSYVRQRLKEGDSLGWYLCALIEQQREPVARFRLTGYAACPVRRGFEKHDTWKLMLGETPPLGFVHSITTTVAGTEHTRTDCFCETWELANQFNIADEVRAYGKKFMEDLKEGDLKFSFRPLRLKQGSDDRKVGRNDSCPCGSGKKYKRCCGK